MYITMYCFHSSVRKVSAIVPCYRSEMEDEKERTVCLRPCREFMAKVRFRGGFPDSELTSTSTAL